MLTVAALLLVPALALQEPSTARASRATLSAGGLEVVVDSSGVLAEAPEGGLITFDGPTVRLAGPVEEWWGVSYRTGGRDHAAFAGTQADWQQRAEVLRVDFAAEADRARCVTRTEHLQITTRYDFDLAGPHLLVSVEFRNIGPDPVTAILHSREWRVPDSGGGFTFPAELATDRLARSDLCRFLWMPNNLLPGEVQRVGFSYTAAPREPADPRGGTLPLVLYRNDTYPGGLQTGSSNGVSWGDVNADGWSDFFVAQGRQLFFNDGGEFLRQPDILLSLPNDSRYGSSFGDYNNDGLPDIGTEPRAFAADETANLLKNLGGGTAFLDVAPDPSIIDQRPRGDAETLCWADVDFDGNLDYFLPVYGPSLGSPGNFFLHNQGPRAGDGEYTFAKKTQQAGLGHPPQNPRPEGAEFCDADQDGDLDLYSNGVLYQNISSTGVPAFQRLTELTSGIVFSNVLDEGCAFLDYDMDGDQDLIIAYCDSTVGVRIFEALGDGTFFLTPTGHIGSHRVGLCLGFSKADWDNDGDIDITTRQIFRTNTFMESGTRFFAVATTGIPSGHLTSATPAWADMDHDGDLDCMLGNWTSVGHLYENTTYDDSQTVDERRHVRVRVMRDDPLRNRGLETEYGATVQIRVADEVDRIRRVQFVSSSGGYLNQNEYVLHFALPADPDPLDPATDLYFDVRVDFVNDPEEGMWRVDRHVNPVLGHIALAELFEREITVFRSGRVDLNGCRFEPAPGARPLLHTSAPLARATPTQALPDPVPAPASAWFQGLAFDTRGATQPLVIKEIVVDGRLDLATDCAGESFAVTVWDVTEPAHSFRVPGAAVSGRAFPRNHRSYYTCSIPLAPGRKFRLAAAVREERLYPLAAPRESGGLRLTGSLRFPNQDACDPTAVIAAVADPTRASIGFHYAVVPTSPWSTLGQGTTGSRGTPRLEGDGGTEPGEGITLRLRQAAPQMPGVLVIGIHASCQPFLGGIRVPSLDRILLLPATGDSGEWSLTGPAIDNRAPGEHFFLQAWILDPAAPGGVAASNALAYTQRH